MNSPISFDLLLQEYPELNQMPLVFLANEFGSNFHFGQLRKNNSIYMTHPYSVLRIAMRVGLREPEILSAILVHDVLEENAHRMPMVLSEMINTLGNSVTQMVITLTDEPGLSREARFEQQLLKMASASPEVVVIKLCDRLAVLQEPGLCAARWQASARHARALIRVAEQRSACHSPLSVVQRRLSHKLGQLITDVA
jgi:(p)ppGpp synthase/HD superfamily hydrolase